MKATWQQSGPAAARAQMAGWLELLESNRRFMKPEDYETVRAELDRIVGLLPPEEPEKRA